MNTAMDDGASEAIMEVMDDMDSFHDSTGFATRAYAQGIFSGTFRSGSGVNAYDSALAFWMGSYPSCNDITLYDYSAN
jgi:hypothetical protein